MIGVLKFDDLLFELLSNYVSMFYLNNVILTYDGVSPLVCLGFTGPLIGILIFFPTNTSEYDLNKTAIING